MSPQLTELDPKTPNLPINLYWHKDIKHIHTIKLVTVGNGKILRLVTVSSKQFHVQRKLNKPPHLQRLCVASGFLSARNKLSRTNNRTLATAQTLITVYQTRPTSLAFIYNSKQGTPAGFHANYWVSNLRVCQLMTFNSISDPSLAGNLLNYPASIGTKE
jgi:hypothetical protein